MKLDRNKILAKLAKLPQVESLVAQKMRSRFEAAHQALLSEFNNHPVTREIEQGPTATNLSGTLSRGNLFSFIGFPADSRPTEELRNMLLTDIRLAPRDKRIEGGIIKFNYRVLIPEERFRARTPMPFESGNSWAYSIETGISGFSQYVYVQLNNAHSRSGHGLQLDGVNLGGSFSPTPYISDLIEKFRQRMRNK